MSDELVIKARLDDDISDKAKRAKRALADLAKVQAASNRNVLADTQRLHTSMKRLSNPAGMLGRMRSLTTGPLNMLNRFRTLASSGGISGVGRAFGSWAKSLSQNLNVLGRMKSAISSIGRSAVTAGGSILKMGAGAAASAGGGLARGAGGLLKRGAFAVGALGTAAGAFGVRAYQSLEQSQIAFKSILQSGPEALTLMGDLERFAKTTPFQIGELRDSAKMLLAGGWKRNEIVPVLTNLGNAAAAADVPVSGLIQQLSQMRAKSQITWGDMRVISDTGIPVLDLLSEKMKMTKQGLMDMMSTQDGGRKLFEMGAIDQLISAVGGRFDGLMTEQSRTLGGMLSNVQDTFSQGMAKIMAPWVENVAKPFLERFQPKFERFMDRTAKLSTKFWAGWNFAQKGSVKGLGDAVRGSVNGFRAAQTPLGSFGRGLRGGLQAVDGMIGKGPRLTGIFDKVAPIVSKILNGLKKIGGIAWTGLTTGISTVFGFFERNKGTIADVAGKLKDVAGIAFTGLKDSLTFIFNHRDVFSSLISGARDAATAIGGMATAAAPVITAIQGIVSAIASIPRNIGINITANAPKILGGVAMAATGPLGAATAVAGALTGRGGKKKGAAKPGTPNKTPQLKSPVGKLGDVIGGPRVRPVRGFRPAHHRPVSSQGVSSASKSFMSSSSFSSLSKSFSTNRVQVTSGHRTHSLGSFNSAHPQGRALDLVGPGLNRVATQVRAVGGYTAFHGNGPTRHLHTEFPTVVAPIGDTTSPRVSPAARPVAGGQSYGGDQFIIHANGLSIDEAKQLVHATVTKRDRDRRERGGR